MSDLLKRLIDLMRANLPDILKQYAPNVSIPPLWDLDFDLDGDERAHARSDGSPSRSGASTGSGSGLPYSDELARCYTVLDLPFGVPRDQVARQWKTYLKQCHPDRFANDPEKLADATELTQALTAAHHTIQAAWQRYQG